MITQKTPLNGTQTHPLSRHALGILAELAQGPKPRQEINPGVVNRFERELLVESIDLPNPYKTKGKTVPGLRITVEGLKRLSK